MRRRRSTWEYSAEWEEEGTSAGRCDFIWLENIWGDILDHKIYVQMI
jgi:hypothetical protein